MLRRSCPLRFSATPLFCSSVKASPPSPGGAPSGPMETKSRSPVQSTGAKDGPPSWEEGQKTLSTEHKPYRAPYPDVLYGGKVEKCFPPADSPIRKWSSSDRKETFHGTWKYTPGWFDHTWEPPLLRLARRSALSMRSWAFWLLKKGKAWTSHYPQETLHRLRRFVTFEGKTPTAGDNAFVAPSAVVVGDVTVGRKATVGYNTIVRGDLGHVEIGESCTVNDKAVVIGPSTLGKWVTIDPMCVVDQATVHSCSFIGSSTILGRGVVVESGSMVCSASVVNPGTIIPSGEIWSGQPAQYLGKVSEEEAEYIIKAAKHMVLINLEHNETCWDLTWEDLEDIRIGREYWCLWAQNMYEFRVRPFYVRDGPKPNRQHGRGGDSPCERFEGRLGMDWESNQQPGPVKSSQGWWG